MARLPRLAVPGYPHHIIQRGNDRQAIFAGAANYQQFLALLEEHARAHQVAIHGYVLMGNHFHLLATPATEAGIPSLMQAIGRRYVRYFNQQQGRSGTLWEGRYRSTVLDAERYLLDAMAYLDLNPVRSGVVAEPADFPWSSHGHYVGRRVDRLLTPHARYWELGNTPFAREQAYSERVRQGIPPALQQALTASALHGWVIGSTEFIGLLQQTTSRRVTKASAGRPLSGKPVPD